MGPTRRRVVLGPWGAVMSYSTRPPTMSKPMKPISFTLASLSAIGLQNTPQSIPQPCSTLQLRPICSLTDALLDTALAAHRTHMALDSFLHRAGWWCLFT